MNKLKYLATALIAITCFGFQQAKADTATYTLTQSNSPGTLGSGPFGTVLVTTPTLNSSTATILFTAAPGYLFVDGGSVAVNVNGTVNHPISFTTNPGANPVTDDSPNQEDGFGVFNVAGSQANSSLGASTVSFTLTLTSGTWASASTVLTPNSQGWIIAAHIQIQNGTGNTGFAAGTLTGTGVPDGGTTVMLLGVALGALGMVRRYLTS
jgi:hypothetical protein